MSRCPRLMAVPSLITKWDRRLHPNPAALLWMERLTTLTRKRKRLALWIKIRGLCASEFSSRRCKTVECHSSLLGSHKLHRLILNSNIAKMFRSACNRALWTMLKKIQFNWVFQRMDDHWFPIHMDKYRITDKRSYISVKHHSRT